MDQFRPRADPDAENPGFLWQPNENGLQEVVQSVVDRRHSSQLAVVARHHPVEDISKFVDFATPRHSWERGTNENTNGPIRQYLSKRTSMAHVTQADLDGIATKLNTRPRKRLGFRTPEECYARA
jgi:IS30 family transposase